MEFLLKSNYADYPPEEWAKVGITSKDLLGTHKKVLAMEAQLDKRFLNRAFISCWTVGNDDSDALWRLYTNVAEGVAVRSTFEGFGKAFESCTGAKIHIGKIKYIDTTKELIHRGNLFNAFLHKRHTFAHETELRAIFLNYDKKDLDGILNHPKGAFVRVDLNALIESVWISPLADDSIIPIIKQFLEISGLGKVPIVKSSLWTFPEELIPPMPAGWQFPE